MRITLRILAVLVISTVGVAGYHGSFSKVSVSEEHLGPFQFVYRPVLSPDYQEVARLTEEVEQLLEAIDVQDRHPLQIYFPDDSAQIGFSVSGVELDLSLSNGTRVYTIAEQQFVVARFPNRSPLSAYIGQTRAGPVMAAHRAIGEPIGSALMSLYDDETITYLRTVENN